MISIMNEQNKNKIKLHFDITLACNNRCSYCYALNELDNSKKINYDVFYSFIKETNKLDNLQIDILGGEPLLVLDEIFILIQNSKHDDFRIFTNFNFKNIKKIELLKNFIYSSNKNIKVCVSIHESSDQEVLKRNILLFKDLIEVTLLLNDNNINYNYNFYLFLKENKIKYSIEELINTNGYSEFSKIKDPKFKEMINNSIMNSEFVTINDKKYSHIDVLEHDLLNISSKYKTICELSELRINFDGNINPICNNPISLGNIKNGINIKNVYCNNYSCRCSANTYKKIFNFKG